MSEASLQGKEHRPSQGGIRTRDARRRLSCEDTLFFIRLVTSSFIALLRIEKNKEDERKWRSVVVALQGGEQLPIRGGGWTRDACRERSRSARGVRSFAVEQTWNK